MNQASQWIERWRVGANNTAVYYKIAGRLILKDSTLYVGDIGPAYLKGVDRNDSARKASDLFLRGTSRTAGTGPLRNAPVANRTAAQQEAWIRRNTNDNPTYRSGATSVQNPGRIFSDSSDELAIYGYRPAPWNTTVKSREIAKCIRRLLNAQALRPTAPPGASGMANWDRDYSRRQTFLPVFTTAIFLAEPARNERAWPINLMLLDLAEHGHRGYTWDAILWHPDAIHIDPRLNVYFGPGPAGRESNERNIVDIRSPEQLHLVGGLLPSSPTGGGERGKPSLFTPPKPLHPQAIAHGAQQGPGTFNGALPYDFIHQKEINVLLPWLMTQAAISAVWDVVPGPPVQETFAIPNGFHLVRPNDILSGANADLALFHNAIRNRIRSLDYMHG